MIYPGTSKLYILSARAQEWRSLILAKMSSEDSDSGVQQPRLALLKAYLKSWWLWGSFGVAFIAFIIMISFQVDIQVICIADKL